MGRLLEFAVEVSALVGLRIGDMCVIDGYRRMRLEMWTSQKLEILCGSAASRICTADRQFLGAFQTNCGNEGF